MGQDIKVRRGVPGLLLPPANSRPSPHTHIAHTDLTHSSRRGPQQHIHCSLLHRGMHCIRGASRASTHPLQLLLTTSTAAMPTAAGVAAPWPAPVDWPSRRVVAPWGRPHSLSPPCDPSTPTSAQGHHTHPAALQGAGWYASRGTVPLHFARQHKELVQQHSRQADVS